MRLIQDRVSDAVLRFLIALALLLPYRLRLAMFGWATSHLIAPVGGFITKGAANLRLVFPDMPEAEARRIARAVADNFGRTTIENYSKREFYDVLGRAKIDGPGLPILKEARAAGRPVLLVSGHIGNYEGFRLALTHMGMESAALYRPAANPFFNRHYAKTLEFMTGPAFPQGRRGLTGFSRHLKNGGIAAMLYDVRATHYDCLDFFGLPAPTSTFAAEIALKTGAIFLPVFARRCADGISHEIAFETPISPSSPREMMAEMNSRLEARIRRDPEQWLWIHDRWGSEAQRRKMAAKRKEQR